MKDHAMFSEDTIEAPALKLPADLLAELGRRKKQQSDYRVDGWKPSLLERLARMLGLG
jgi:hypothetical protein